MRPMTAFKRQINSIFSTNKQEDDPHEVVVAAVDTVKKPELQYITIFPFQNLSDDKDCNFIGYGIAEALYSKLSHVRGVHVIERSQLLTAVEMLNGVSYVVTDPSKALRLGMTFGARTVVYGSYEKTDKSIKISATLASQRISPATSHREVSGIYSDIFDLQSELALNLISALGVPINGTVVSTINQPEHNSINEYEWNSRGIESVDISQDEDEAIYCFNQAIMLNGDQADMFLNLAIAYGCRCDYTRAIRTLDMAVGLEPRSCRAYNNRGSVYLRMGDYGRAISDYNKVIELNPEFPAAFNNRGSVFYEKNDYRKAIADFTHAIRLNPDYALAHYNRGIAYGMMQDFDSAIADYSMAIDLNPDYSSAYNNRGVAYTSVGNDDLAISDYNRVIELNPESATAYNNRGNLHLKKGNHVNALNDYSKAISLNPKSSEAYCNRANVYYENDDTSHAIADYTTAIELNCDYYGAYLNRGFVYESIGEKESAQNDFRKAIELDCKHFQDLVMNEQAKDPDDDGLEDEWADLLSEPDPYNLNDAPNESH
ncbi:MAG: tetratricopeptide repeat protein [Armatimonadota bacterium]